MIDCQVKCDRSLAIDLSWWTHFNHLLTDLQLALFPSNAEVMFLEPMGHDDAR
jgi:hypothetical protein